jgi:4-amino-4-deoxy-L-arabinose transferase-like glycosyltransferase
MKRALAAELLLFLLFAAVYGIGIRAFGMLAWDEAEYATLGRSLATGEGYAIGGVAEYNRLPLLPAILGFAFRIGLPVTDVTARGVAIVLALATLAIVWFFVRREQGRGVAVMATILCGLAPAFWTRTPQVMADVVFAGLFAAAVWTLREALAHDARRMWLAAALALLAFLARYTAVLFFPVAVVLAIAAAVRSREALRRLVSPHTAGAALAALVMLVPWFVRTMRVTGDPWAGLRWAAMQVPSYLPGESLPWHYYGSALPEMLSLPSLLFLLVGIAVALRKRDAFCVDSLLAALVMLLYFSAFRYKDDRFVLAAVPLLAPAAARGLGAIAQRIAGARDQWVVVALAILLTLVMTLGPVTAVLRGAKTFGYPALVDAASRLRTTLPRDAVLATAIRPQATWYFQRKVVPLPATRAGAAELKASHAVIVNFERGQPGWVAPRVPAAMRDPRCAAKLYVDGRWAVAVMKRECL